MYSDLDFKEIYGIPFDKLNLDYTNFLSMINTKKDIDKANFYFGRKSIFYKVCPRYIAYRLRKAWNLYNEKEYNKAKNVFEDIFSLGKNYSSLIGMANCESKLNQNIKAVELLKSNISFYKNTGYYYNIELSLADFLAKGYNYSEADTNYSLLINQNPNRSYYYLSRIRKELFKDSLINIYLDGNEFDKFQVIKSLNENNYDYNSIPVFIDLARELNEQYELFVKNFDKTIHVKDYSASYAMYKLSIYMLENMDFSSARKMSALSLRYNADENFNYILQNNYIKTDWFYYNGERILKQLIFK